MTTTPDAGSHTTSSMTLTIPIDRKYDAAIKLAAKKETRPVAGYIRNLIMQDLRTKGLVDEQLELMPESA